MFLKEILDQNTCTVSILACIFLTICYVGSLYVWRSPLSRDHPSTIKKRFFSVICMMVLAPFYIQIFLTEETFKKGDLFTHLGLRRAGLIEATIYPLFLTLILFMGPLSMQFLSGLWSLYTEPVYWLASWQDLVWVRNHVMAPLSEEWVFRACMMPLLLQCFEPLTAVFLGPFLFGTAHFHHVFEQIRSGNEIKTAILVSSFQFMYTCLFGAYSAYLFIRTGHLIAPLLAHTFCNHMGFPNFPEILQYRNGQRVIIVVNFLVGFALWCLLLKALTDPELYDNRLHWDT